MPMSLSSLAGFIILGSFTTLFFLHMVADHSRTSLHYVKLNPLCFRPQLDLTILIEIFSKTPLFPESTFFKMINKVTNYCMVAIN